MHRAKSLRMCSELIRLATFQDFHGQYLSCPSSLARLGFSYQKESGSLVCFSCSCSVDYRQESHSLAQFHLKSSLQCKLAIEQESESTWCDLQRIWKSDECRGDARDGDKPLLSLRQKDDNVDAQPRGGAECAKHMDDASKNKIQDLFATAMQRAERNGLFNGDSSLDASATASETVPNASIKGPAAAAFEDTQSTAIPSIPAREVIDRTKPNFHQLKKESARLSTFYDWPVTAHAQPAQIARTGYFYTGLGDRVQCAFGKEYLKNWVKGDVPDEEHWRRFPKCPFVLLNGDDNVPLTAEQHSTASERDVGQADRNVESIATTSQHRQQKRLLHYTLDAAADQPALPNVSTKLSAATAENAVATTNQESESEQEDEWELCLTGSDEESSDKCDLYINSVRAKTPNYMSITKRIESFAGKPVAAGKTPEILASAGFYYSGPFDNVRCYFCNGGLKKWQPDDEAWTAHARWFPRCQYVNKYKSPEFIQTAQIPRTRTLRENRREGQLYSGPQRESHPPAHPHATHMRNASPTANPLRASPGELADRHPLDTGHTGGRMEFSVSPIQTNPVERRMGATDGRRSAAAGSPPSTQRSRGFSAASAARPEAGPAATQGQPVPGPTSAAAGPMPGPDLAQGQSTSAAAGATPGAAVCHFGCSLEDAVPALENSDPAGSTAAARDGN